MRPSRSVRSGSVQIQAVKASLMRPSFSLAASVASTFSTRFSAPSSTTVSQICGVALFSASCSRVPAWRRGVPQPDVPAAVPAKALPSTDQVASASVCWTRTAAPITCVANASTTSVGIQGAPSRGGDVGGFQVIGCTSRSASTLRRYCGSSAAAASAVSSLLRTAPDR